MLLAMRLHQSPLSSVKPSLDFSHGSRTPPLHTSLTPRLALAWVGLLVGICVLALPGALLAWLSAERSCLIAHGPEDSPGAIRLVTGVFPAWSGAGGSPVVVSTDHGWLPRHRLARDVREADDDDPVTGAMGAATARGLPPTPHEAVPAITPRHGWPFRFLTRPQLLTRFSALPAGRDLP
jgi:hypothetical protein